MISCRELRARARQTLGGNIFKPQWLFALLVMLIVSLATSLVSSTGIGAPVVFVFTGPIYVGVNAYFLSLNRRANAHEDMGTMFDGFKKELGNNIVTGLLVNVFTFLWSLLFIIPGIVKSYSYAMTYYIRVDHPEYTATEAITKSREMMNGHKGKLFLLDLSFIGWIIVGALCCGIGTLWVAPYMQAAKTSFYEELKAKAEPVVPPVTEEASTEEAPVEETPAEEETETTEA